METLYYVWKGESARRGRRRRNMGFSMIMVQWSVIYTLLILSHTDWEGMARVIQFYFQINVIFCQ